MARSRSSDPQPGSSPAPIPKDASPGDPPTSVVGPRPVPVTPPPSPPVVDSRPVVDTEKPSGDRPSETPPRTGPPAAPPVRTRSSTAYVGVGVGLAVLVLVLVFIIQNLNDASVHYLGLHFRLPIGLLILAGAVAGGVIVLLVSLARVTQLRVRARRSGHGRHDVH